MFKIARYFLSVLWLLSYSNDGLSQRLPDFISPASSAWADSVFNTLSYEQKIGQLFMIDVYSNRDSVHVKNIAGLIENYHIGGLIFFQGGPVRQALMTNYFQSLSKVKLLIGIDGEWGLSMRLDSTIRFPRQMTLGATASDTLIQEMAAEIGRQCKRMGIHLNFAPVADINNNPRNPVINSRSFGESREQVANYARLYTRGLQSQHVMACGKHFPGHGNTDTDSHFTLPVIRNTASQLDSVELFPFKQLISDGIASMMVAHLNIPSLDTTPGLASTLSKPIVQNLLKDKLGFKGLVVTDALNMKGVADFNLPGDLELKALLAGNDVLLYSSDIPKAWMRIHYAIQNCEIDQEMIDDKVKQILMSKYWVGLSQYQPVDTTRLIVDLNTAEANYLNQKLYERSFTLLQNKDGYLPVVNRKGSRILSIAVNDTLNNPFQLMLKNFGRVDVLRIARNDTLKSMIDSVSAIAKNYEHVILSIHNTSTKAESGYGISEKINQLIYSISGKTDLTTVIFGNAYCLSRVPDATGGKAVLLAYEDTYLPQYFASQALFGAAQVGGVLPVSPVPGFRSGDGLSLDAGQNRLRFTNPLELGIDPAAFRTIDSLALKAVRDSATPGCQVLVAWKGNIIYRKSFGSYTYENIRETVTDTTRYDIASITKIASTALAVMKLYEDEKIDLDKRASKYFHPLRKTNKRELIVEDILLHQAGLKSWIPFWKSTMDNNRPSFNIYHYEPDVNYSVQVADSLFILNSYADKIWKEIYDSPVEQEGKYVYSDLGMLLMQKVVEEVSEMSLDNYVENKFYAPLGLNRLMYNPSAKIPVHYIAPTEIDIEFRKRKLQGFVHDPAAAMLGGVAGHAGLFSDAFDVAVIMQMLLNKGQYGGIRYLSEETVELFTSRCDTKGDNRRGLIFDKPEVTPGKNGNTPPSASLSTFGHTGFTGTAAWADPEHDLVFVFLSNRVYPNAVTNKLAKGNYRTDIMEAVYKIINQVTVTKTR